MMIKNNDKKIISVEVEIEDVLLEEFFKYANKYGISVESFLAAKLREFIKEENL